MAADLAVSVQMASAVPAHCEAIRHGGALPRAAGALRQHVRRRRGRARRWPSGSRALLRQAYGVADCLAAE